MGSVGCKAGHNRRLFDMFGTDFIDRHGRSSLVDMKVEVSLSDCCC